MTVRLTHFLVLLFSMAVSARGQDVLLFDFESPTYGDWEIAGDAFGAGPVSADRLQVSGYRGARLVNSFGSGDPATGAIASPTFNIGRDYLTFLIGGGRHEGETGIELLVDGEPVRSATGDDSSLLRWVSWDVVDLRGRSAKLRIFDRATGGWGHIDVDEILLTDCPRTGAGTWRLDEYRRSDEYYRERFRPAWHFTPELNWMNDPNGLVYFDGEYHLFYQHNPLGNEWGHMSWGHAVSHDLLHWQHLPIALHEEYGVMAFSGSAVVDMDNTSGLGTKSGPPLVALYTGHGHGRQTQDLAFSTDRGRTWTKFAGNPVLDIGESEFRDPKVFWHAGTHRWVMVVSLAPRKRLRFYASPDLRQWTLLSEFGPAGAPDKLNWECPDLFELPIENEPGSTRWVLEADMGNGAVAGGSGGEYFTGMFDGAQFVPDSQESQWVDYGRDFYAPVSWSNLPHEDGRRIWIAWMNNWETCLNPTRPWRSALSVPRELTLRRIDGALRLCQRPVRELEQLRTRSWHIADRRLENEALELVPRGRQFEIHVEFEPETATDFGLRVFQHGDQRTVIGYNVESRSLMVDRTQSGNVSFHAAFAGCHAAPLAPDGGGRIRLQVLLDASSVEVFGNDGESVITDLVFPDADSTGLALFAAGGQCRVVSCDVHELKSVWHRAQN